MEIINKLIEIKQIVYSGLADQTDSEIKAIINDDVLRAYLFELLAQKEFHVPDFSKLNEDGAFDIELAPFKSKRLTINGKEKTFWSSWFAVPYLKKAGSFILKDADKAVVEILRDIITQYIHTRENKNDKDASFDDIAIGELILCLPIDQNLLYDRNFCFIRDVCLQDRLLTISYDIMERFFPRVLTSENTRVALQTIKLLFSYQVNTVGFRSVESRVDDFYLKEFVEKFAVKSFEFLGTRLFKQLFDLIELIQIEDNFCFSSIYIEAPLNLSSSISADKISVIIVDFIIHGINNLTQKHTPDLLELIKFYDGIIFDRIVLYFINKFYSETIVQRYFWTLDNPLNRHETETEVVSILNDHKLEFSLDQKAIFVNWIDELAPDRFRNEDVSDFESRRQSIKLYWQNCLKNDVVMPNNNNQSILRSAVVYPATDNRIDYLDKQELEGVLLSNSNWGNYNQFALVQDLRNLPLERRQELIDNPEAYKFLPEVLYALIQGSGQVELRNWQSFFSLIRKQLDRPDLWLKENFESKQRHLLGNENYSDRLITSFVEQIRFAAKQRNEKYLSSEYCSEAIELLVMIEGKYKGSFEVLNNGQEYFDAINSVRGTIYETLLEISVTLSVLNERKEFDQRISDFIQFKLSDDNTPEELLWVIGGNLVKIGYMDIGWISRNQSLLFGRPDTQDLKVLKTYLLYANSAYKDLYQILHPYYKLALKIFVSKTNYTSKLVQHICIAFSRQWEHSTELVQAFFEEANAVQLEEMINYYGHTTKKSELDDLQEQTVAKLWQLMLENLDGLRFEEKEQSAFNLMRWAKNFRVISESTNNLIDKTMELLSNFPFDYHVLNHFANISSIDAEPVGLLVEKALEKSNSFDISSYDNLKIITRNLYDQNKEGLADRIVEKLASLKYFFLVDTYISYHGVA